MSQPLPLVEQLKNLEHLQELDIKIDSLRKDKSTLPGGLRTVDESLVKLKSAVESKKNLLSEIEKVQRQSQAALDLNQDRLTRSSSKLEAVQNSQEFQAANKEIEQLKKLNLTLEEQGKKSNREIELLGKEVGTLHEQMKVLQQDRDAQVTVLSGQENQFKTDIDSLLAERSKYSSRVEPRILAQYEKVRGARGGIGIVPALGGRCKGCNMMVPPQLYNEVQRGTTLHSCPSCHRILFIPPSPAPSAEEGKSVLNNSTNRIA